MINKDGITFYDTKTGRPYHTSWGEVDQIYNTLGPEKFHALLYLGASTRFPVKGIDDEEMLNQVLSRYPRPESYKTSNAEVKKVRETTKQTGEKLEELARKLDEAIKREDWYTVRVLKKQIKSLEEEV